MNKTPMFSHDRDLKKGKEEWLTPPHITTTLGPFDLDPCSPIVRPWPTAATHMTITDDGLLKPWTGFVWCNPPYGSKTGKWLARCADHANCIALIFARTDTRAWQNHIFPKASSLFFIAKRLTFHHVSGQPAKESAGAPSVLIAYGPKADNKLRSCTLKGHYVSLR